MELSEAKALINELKGRFDSPFNSTDKESIEKLYLEVCGKVFIPTSCQNCYHDALLEVINYLKHHKTMAEKCNFRLKAGAIIHSTVFMDGQIFTNDNLTDEVASAYLSRFPGEVGMFQKVPEGWEPGQVIVKEAPRVESPKDLPDHEEAIAMKVKAERTLKGAQTKLETAKKNVEKAGTDEKKKAKALESLKKAEASVEKAQKNLNEIVEMISELT